MSTSWQCLIIILDSQINNYQVVSSLGGVVGWGCIIHQLLLFGGVRPPPNEYP